MQQLKLTLLYPDGTEASSQTFKSYTDIQNFIGADQIDYQTVRFIHKLSLGQKTFKQTNKIQNKWLKILKITSVDVDMFQLLLKKMNKDDNEIEDNEDEEDNSNEETEEDEEEEEQEQEPEPPVIKKRGRPPKKL